MEHVLQNQIPNILLADDDADERYFFEIALKKLPIVTNLKTVPDGARLMEYLSQNSDNLPDVLFLDIFMPRKNGIECLTEIMRNEKLKQIPVIMYSNSVGDNYIIKCYQYGAFYFLQKGNYSELTESISKLLAILAKTPNQASKDRFKFSLQEEY